MSGVAPLSPSDPRLFSTTAPAPSPVREAAPVLSPAAVQPAPAPAENRRPEEDRSRKEDEPPLPPPRRPAPKPANYQVQVGFIDGTFRAYIDLHGPGPSNLTTRVFGPPDGAEPSPEAAQEAYRRGNAERQERPHVAVSA